jgi:hypothetical protein
MNSTGADYRCEVLLISAHDFLRSALRVECQSGRQQERTRQEPDRHSKNGTQEQTAQNDTHSTFWPGMHRSGPIPLHSAARS